MLKEEIQKENIDDELLACIYKAIEVFDIIKNTTLKIDNERINDENKKYLSLFLGIYLGKNDVSKIFRLFRYSYGIEVYTYTMPETEYINLYKNNFKDLLESMLVEENIMLEEFMLKLIEVDFIKNMHYNRGFSLMAIKTLLNKSIGDKKEEKIKTLQKN